MVNKKYDEIVEKHKPTEKRSTNLLIAFLVGGAVGSLGEIIIQVLCFFFHISRTVSSVYMIVIMIFFAALFTAIGFFDKWVNFARCGLIIPITGFSHSMMSAALEYKKEGVVLGVGGKLFSLAGPVLVCGITSSILVGFIYLLLDKFGIG